MLIKTAPFTPIQITLETEDDYHEMAGLLQHAKQSHPSARLRKTASKMLDDTSKVLDDSAFLHDSLEGLIHE